MRGTWPSLCFCATDVHCAASWTGPRHHGVGRPLRDPETRETHRNGHGHARLGGSRVRSRSQRRSRDAAAVAEQATSAFFSLSFACGVYSSARRGHHLHATSSRPDTRWGQVKLMRRDTLLMLIGFSTCLHSPESGCSFMSQMKAPLLLGGKQSSRKRKHFQFHDYSNYRGFLEELRSS